jgi:hypothetical protein
MKLGIVRELLNWKMLYPTQAPTDSEVAGFFTYLRI